MANVPVRGCPYCHAAPAYSLFHVDGYEIHQLACEHHPEHPVFLNGESVAAVFDNWNGTYDWQRMGAPADRLATRPVLSVEVDLGAKVL